MSWKLGAGCAFTTPGYDSSHRSGRGETRVPLFGGPALYLPLMRRGSRNEHPAAIDAGENSARSKAGKRQRGSLLIAGVLDSTPARTRVKANALTRYVTELETR